MNPLKLSNTVFADISEFNDTVCLCDILQRPIKYYKNVKVIPRKWEVSINPYNRVIYVPSTNSTVLFKPGHSIEVDA